MYNNYFGFREKPFKLVPNPEYLFLSKTHEIALAHLTFAAEQGDGFVVIIGEVGTGKTTLCRNYLESLNEKTDSAYIFNPHLDSNELLAGICHEYGKRTKEKGTKALLDILNEFLITQNAAGRKVVLLIDEAQLLSTENLEMVRMLSNLETTKNKLLQIILVGQPELAGKLETYELRQLAQRISLNYHLTPLTAEDTQAYIQHRIGIASKRYAQLFTTNACKLAFQYSKGIPRLINIVCDRALLVAFSQDKSKVNKAIMKAAISEVDTSSPTTSISATISRKVWGAGIAALVIIGIAVAYFLLNSNDTSMSRQSENPTAGRGASTASSTKASTHKVPDDARALAPTAQNRPMVEESDLPTEIVGQAAAQRGADSNFRSDKMPTGQSAPRDIKVPPAIATNQVDVKSLLGGLDPFGSRKACATKLLSLWQQTQINIDLIPNEVDDSSFFDIAARQYGLRNYEVIGNWELVKEIALPAILTLRPSGQDVRVFLNLVGQRDNILQVAKGRGDKVYEVDARALRPYLDGAVHVFWKNIIGFDMIIGYGSDDRAVLMVKNLLRKIGYTHITLSPEFDYDTRRAIRDFQKERQLKVDGLVGPLTKIMLLREAGTAGMPHLNSDMRADS